MTAAHRDLSEPELWERSLERSRLRRALLPRARRELKRRKGLSAAAAAATMAGPTAPMAMAQISGNVQAEVAAETPSTRAIEVRDGGLPLRYGSQGELVAHVQKALQIPADGVFGAQTDTAVRQYQTRAGLQVDGIVGPATWASLFESGSAVGGSNVSAQVTERIEQKLEAAGRRIDAQAATVPGTRTSAPTPDSGGDAAGDPVGGSVDGTADTPVSGQAESPSVGGTTPVSGACGSTVSSPVDGTVTSGFGPRGGRNHDGLDIAAPTGTPVRAAACGSVSLAGTQDGYGNIVCITHSNQFSTCYAHLSRFATSQGAQVQQGQVIGYVGCTGSCTGPHVHFETRVNGQAQDPRGYLGGAAIPGASATPAKARSTAGATNARAAKTSTGRTPATVATVSGSGSAVAPKDALAAREAAAMAAVGPTTPTAPPGTPEAMTAEGAPAPAEAAPVPTDAYGVPLEAAPAAPVPTETAPVPTEAAPVPVEAAPVPTEAAPVPVETAPLPTEPAPAPAAPVPVPVEPAPVPVEAAPAQAPAPAPVPVEAAPAPVPVEAAPAPAPAPAPVEAAPAPAPAPAAPVPAAPAPAPVAPAPAPAEPAPAPAEPAPAETGVATDGAVTDTTATTSSNGGAPVQ
jgi:murein DD-endopeptidase MepM/ murein hydrolase activator NlpD